MADNDFWDNIEEKIVEFAKGKIPFSDSQLRIELIQQRNKGSDLEM